jgi:hypothetical protein
LFETALELARARGYLARPEYGQLLAHVPGWLVALWTPAGPDRLQQRLGVGLPAAVRAFYATRELVVCVHSLDPHERDFFFAATGEEPGLCSWGGVQYLEVALHGHSGGVYAVRLGAGDDPPMATGFADEGEAIGALAESFSGFIRRAVERGPSPEVRLKKGTL